MRQRFTLAHFFGLLLISFSLIHCQNSQEEICAQTLPYYYQQVSDARLVLQPGGRRIASLEKAKKKLQLSQSRDFLHYDRDQWQRFAKNQLAQVQEYVDGVDQVGGYSNVRKNLMLMANEWVSFYGSARDGNQSKMNKNLSKIQKYTAKVQDEFCFEEE